MEAGTRVRLQMASGWPAGEWFGVVDGGRALPGDTRTAVRIDSGALILYGDEVTIEEVADVGAAAAV